jgi:polynucleotide 5'-kinase involved in rRNA processing
VQELVAADRLLATARARMARYIIIDSPGWVVGPAAVEFQVRMIDLLSPDRVVAIRRGPELGEILVNFRHRPGMTIHRFFPHPAVRARTPGCRSQ